METKEKVVQEAGEMMGSLRESISKIVSIRLDLMKKIKWLSDQKVELELAANEMDEAVEALFRVETAMGNAHQNLLVSSATLRYADTISRV